MKRTGTYPGEGLLPRSVRTGARKFIMQDDLGGTLFRPEEKYVVYYDPGKKNYLSYEVATGLLRNITRNIPVSWTGDDDQPWSPHENISVAAGLKDDQGLLVYDHYDLWQLDPAGRRAPVNLTRGYGQKHHIILRLLDEAK